MKLAGFTLIEGIVSMVLMSILLTVGIIVTFNLYKSYPSAVEIRMEEILSNELNAIIVKKEVYPTSYDLNGFAFECYPERSAQFKNIIELNAVLSDSLGHKVEQKRLFLHYEK